MFVFVQHWLTVLSYAAAQLHCCKTVEPLCVCSCFRHHRGLRSSLTVMMEAPSDGFTKTRNCPDLKHDGGTQGVDVVSIIHIVSD